MTPEGPTRPAKPAGAERPIGVFDSGIGGLTVMHALMERLLAERRVMAVLCEVGFSCDDVVHTQLVEVLPLMEVHGFALAGLYDIAGFRHLRDWGCTFANALFVRRDLIGHYLPKSPARES